MLRHLSDRVLERIDAVMRCHQLTKVPLGRGFETRFHRSSTDGSGGFCAAACGNPQNDGAGRGRGVDYEFGGGGEIIVHDYNIWQAASDDLLVPNMPTNAGFPFPITGGSSSLIYAVIAGVIIAGTVYVIRRQKHPVAA